MKPLMALLLLAACAGAGVRLDRATLPAYLDPLEVEDVLAEAVERWAVCGVSPHAIVRFKRLGWVSPLALGKPGEVVINQRYRWVLHVDEGCDGAFHLPSVFLHELGHAGGIGHRDDPRDVMFHTFEPCMERRTIGVCPAHGR